MAWIFKKKKMQNTKKRNIFQIMSERNGKEDSVEILANANVNSVRPVHKKSVKIYVLFLVWYLFVSKMTWNACSSFPLFSFSLYFACQFLSVHFTTAYMMFEQFKRIFRASVKLILSCHSISWCHIHVFLINYKLHTVFSQYFCSFCTCFQCLLIICSGAFIFLHLIGYFSFLIWFLGMCKRLFYLYYSFVVKGLVRATLSFSPFLLFFFVLRFMVFGAAVVNVDIVDGRLCWWCSLRHYRIHWRFVEIIQYNSQNWRTLMVASHIVLSDTDLSTVFLSVFSPLFHARNWQNIVLEKVYPNCAA